jgi:hypothetical protein
MLENKKKIAAEKLKYQISSQQRTKSPGDHTQIVCVDLRTDSVVDETQQIFEGCHSAKDLVKSHNFTDKYFDKVYLQIAEISAETGEKLKDQTDMTTGPS